MIAHAEITRAAASLEKASIEQLSAFIAATRDGASAIDSVTEAALAEAGASVEAFTYDPRGVPLVDEFAADTMAGATSARCLIGRLAGRGEGRSILLFAHPDTEPVEMARDWSRDPFTPTIDQGCIYGWGVADDLAGMGMLVQSINVLREAGLAPRGDVFLIDRKSVV